MTTIDYVNLLQRCAALQIEAMLHQSTPVTADAKPYFLHTQEAFPYFTNRIGGDEIDSDSQDFDRDTITVTMRLVIGHVTEGYQGEPETNLYTWMPVIKEYFNERELLQSAAYPTAMTSLIEARVTGHNGFRVFQNTGLSANQVGTEFTLTCQMDESIDQAYT